VRLRQFLRSLTQSIRPDTPLAECERVLDKWTTIVCQALYFRTHSPCRTCHQTTPRGLAASPQGPSSPKNAWRFVARLYAASSMAVRLNAWQTIRAIVHRPAAIYPNDQNYVHSSWIRHGHVEAARGLTRDDDHGGTSSQPAVNRQACLGALAH
jgi:hypothetical protein